MTRLARIPVASVALPPRIRMVDEGEALARGESMKAHGQRTPIDVAEREGEGGFVLIAGAHRLRGAQLTGMAELDAIVWPGEAFDDPDAHLLHEVLENFERFDLTKLDRARNLKVWREVYERQHGTAGHGGDRRSAEFATKVREFATRFSDVAAGRLGISERTVSEAIQIAGAITPPIYAIIHAHRPIADKRSELLALARIETEAVREKAAAHAVAEGVGVEAALTVVLGKVQPKPAERWETTALTFGRLKPLEQERVLEANADAVERWYQKRQRAR